MTQHHCSGSGRVVRTWCDDESLDRREERGRGPHHGGQPGREPSGRFRWILRAKDNGAKIICVDPRFTRSASKADIYAPLRPGTTSLPRRDDTPHSREEALSGGVVRNYTNASYLVNPDFRMPGDLNGLFSGTTRRRGRTTRNRGRIRRTRTKRSERIRPSRIRTASSSCWGSTTPATRRTSSPASPERRRRRSSRSTRCTVPREARQSGDRAVRDGVDAAHGGNAEHPRHDHHPDAPRQHGVAGGGINACAARATSRARPTTGSSSTFCRGTWRSPPRTFRPSRSTSRSTRRDERSAERQLVGNRNKYITSYLKAIYGAKATKENDFGYAWLPKTDPGMNASWLMIFDNMSRGKYKGFFAWGQNPACSGTNAGKVRKALSTLEWMVTVTCSTTRRRRSGRGRGGPGEGEHGGLLPPRGRVVREGGERHHSSRMGQWRTAAVRPLGSRSPTPRS